MNMSQQPASGRPAPLRRTAGRRGAVAPRALLSFLNLPGLGNKTKEREVAKQRLLDIIQPLKRGVLASDEDKAAVDQAAQVLERINPTPKSVTSPLLNGSWELLYTTSKSVLATNRPSFLQPSGPIYQILDNRSLRARNKEGPPFRNEVSANLEPVSGSLVKVKFDEFKLLGLFPVKAPPSAVGSLDVTYLDEDLRISRGDKGSLFVLRMADRDTLPDDA